MPGTRLLSSGKNLKNARLLPTRLLALKKMWTNIMRQPHRPVKVANNLNQRLSQGSLTHYVQTFSKWSRAVMAHQIAARRVTQTIVVMASATLTDKVIARGGMYTFLGMLTWLQLSRKGKNGRQRKMPKGQKLNMVLSKVLDPSRQIRRETWARGNSPRPRDLRASKRKRPQNG